MVGLRTHQVHGIALHLVALRSSHSEMTAIDFEECRFPRVWGVNFIGCWSSFIFFKGFGDAWLSLGAKHLSAVWPQNGHEV